jgi:hypothetical protein
VHRSVLYTPELRTSVDKSKTTNVKQKPHFLYSARKVHQPTQLKETKLLSDSDSINEVTYRQTFKCVKKD